MSKKLEVEYQNNNKEIYAPLKKKYLIATPEEIVRQEFIVTLVNDYGYSLEQMEQEKSLAEYSDRGTGKASADVVIWKSKEDKQNSKNAFMIIECKAKDIKLTDKDYFQGANYARWAGAYILVVTNLKETKVFEILKEELPYQKRPISNIPKYEIINDDEKLKEEILKTTTFKRDEFAKLLHKCHNIIRNNDKLSPEASFDEISKILFMKILYERNPKGDEIFSLEQFNKLKSAYEMIRGKGDDTSYIQKLFSDTKDEFKEDNLFEDNEKIKIREKSFEDIVKELQSYNLSNTSDDIKGIAFERFLGRTFRGELGQFFTPRVIVDFMVELLEPKEGEIICDPCSGSGGFLIKAFEHIRKDIEDDIQAKIEKIQKEKFGDDMSKIDDETISKEVEKEIQNLKNELLLSTNRDEVKTRIDKLSKSCIFGTDANPRMARVSKMNMIMHGDGHGGVHHNDGLLNINGIFEERFDMIVTNPPFGTRVDKELKIEKSDRYNDDIKIAKYKAKYGERYEKVLDDMDNYIEENKSITSLYNTSEYSTLTETLFMERCINLLKKGGRMGIVLPEGVLNSSNLEKVREYFESRAKILLIVSLPQEIFISSGATVKTSLLFLKRFTNTEEIEYNKIKEETTQEINSKYKSKENEIKAPLLSKAKELEQLKDAISKIKEAKKDSKVDNKGINTLLGGLAGLAVSENIGGGIIGAIAGVSLTAMKENDDKKKIEVQLKELQSKEKDIKKDIKPLQKEEKSLLQELEAKKTQEIKELIKERFDYEIPIADIQQAGISATGTKIENELPQLLKEFKKYRKSNKLWGDSISTIGQLLEEI